MHVIVKVMQSRVETIGSVSIKAEEISRSNWSRSLAVGALAFSVLAGACGAESSEKDPLPDGIVMNLPDAGGSPFFRLCAGRTKRQHT